MNPDSGDRAISFATGEGIEETYVDVAGVRTFVRYSPGSGPTLVLLPGGMLDSSLLTWRHALEALPARFRVFVPDLPGYGRSSFPEGAPFTTEWFADWLVAFAAQMHLDRFALGGSSMSGAVALTYALRHPERVEKLVLNGAYGFQDRVLLHEAAASLVRMPGLAALFRGLLTLHPAVMKAALHTAVWNRAAITDQLAADSLAGLDASHALEAFARWLRSELLPHRTRTDLTPRLPDLDVPVLLLHGAHDFIAPVHYARRAAQHLPRAELHVFSGAGHLVPREFPAQVNARLVGFLSA